ncbi:MAG: hypothetical protein NT099_01595 [Candidatus Saganbacteria bacterium]|nr:hypothetical protein [Candidatus Saganbacteria bacterium]
MTLDMSRGRPITATPINTVNITDYVRARAAKSAVVHDISKLPQQLLAAVVNAALNKLSGLSFCFESNGKQTTVSGMDLIKSLQQAGFPPHQIALILDTMVSRRRSPGPDNLVHYKFSELKEIAEDSNLTNAFYAKAQKAISTKSLASFEPQPDPLSGIPQQVARLDQPNPLTAAPGTREPAGAKAVVVHDQARLFALVSPELSIDPEQAKDGARQLALLAK